VQHGRYVLGLRDSDCSFSEVHAAMLRALEALSVLAALESRESYCVGITEEILVGDVKVADGI